MSDLQDEFTLPPQSAKDVGGVSVDSVRASQASHAMANGRGDSEVSTRADADREFQSLMEELNTLNEADARMQVRLAESNSQVRRKRLAGPDYTSICQRQVALKDSIARNGTRRGQIKLRVEQLKSLCKEFKSNAPVARPLEDLMAKILREMRQMNATMAQFLQSCQEKKK